MHVQITDDYVDSHQIRDQVFQQEQCIEHKLDIDGEDENALHFVAYNNEEKPIGTARVRFFDQGKTAKIERLAVLKEYRGHGVGKGIIESIIEYLENRHIEKAYIDTQKYLQKFYEHLGFKVEGKEFKEAGIPHIKMTYFFTP